jgi:hypothetical protein
MKQLDFAGTKLSEVGIFLLIVIAAISASHFIWGADTTIYLCLTSIFLWIFLHVKKSKITWERFDEIDQRDMDFKDEFDKKYEKILTQLNKKAPPIEPPPLSPEEMEPVDKDD